MIKSPSCIFSYDSVLVIDLLKKKSKSDTQYNKQQSAYVNYTHNHALNKCPTTLLLYISSL